MWAGQSSYLTLPSAPRNPLTETLKLSSRRGQEARSLFRLPPWAARPHCVGSPLSSRQEPWGGASLLASLGEAWLLPARQHARPTSRRAERWPSPATEISLGPDGGTCRRPPAGRRLLYPGRAHPAATCSPVAAVTVPAARFWLRHLQPARGYRRQSSLLTLWLARGGRDRG